MDAQEAQRLESSLDCLQVRGDLEEADRLATQYLAQAGPPSPREPARSPGFRAGYLAAQVALAAGRAEQALHRLEPLLPLASRLTAELACRLHLLAAEANGLLQRHDEAAACLARAAATGFAVDSDPQLHFRQLRIRLWRGELSSLREELAACDHALNETGDTANRVLLACDEALALYRGGDLSGAADCWTRAANLGRDCGVPRLYAVALVQLGWLRHLRGHLQPALDSYAQAESLVPAGSPLWLEVELRRLLVRLDLNQWDGARVRFAELLRDREGARLSEDVRGLICLLDALLSPGPLTPAASEADGFLALTRQDWDRAQEQYRLALARTTVPEQQARLTLALGLLALNRRQQEEAERWLLQAEEHARARDLPEVLWRALRGRGLALALRGAAEDEIRPVLEEAVVLAEEQAGRLRAPRDAADYRQHRVSVVRELLLGACRGGRPADVFRYQEILRGRFLLELWQAEERRTGQSPRLTSPRLEEVHRLLEEGQRELHRQGGLANEALHRRRQELLLERDRLLDDWLRDRQRPAGVVPAVPTLDELAQALPPETLYIAPSLLDEELYLLVVHPGGRAEVIAAGSGQPVRQGLETFRAAVTEQLERYASPHGRLGLKDRAVLDGHLANLGGGPLGQALAGVLGSSPARSLLWVPDPELHALPLAALQLQGRYLVETHTVVVSFSGALVLHLAGQRKAPNRRTTLVVAGDPDGELMDACREGQRVQAAFRRARLLQGSAATRAALRAELGGTRVLHLACHAHFDADHPLAAYLQLPSGEAWRATDWLAEPVDGLPLLTLSACRSAAVGALAATEPFGLPTAALAAGVRAVLAGLWPVADRETLLFMEGFYRHALVEDLAGALVQAQREALRAADSSPLFWAPFVLYGDPNSLPSQTGWRRWWGRWRQRRYAATCRRYAAREQREGTR